MEYESWSFPRYYAREILQTKSSEFWSFLANYVFQNFACSFVFPHFSLTDPFLEVLCKKLVAIFHLSSYQLSIRTISLVLFPRCKVFLGVSGQRLFFFVTACYTCDPPSIPRLFSPQPQAPYLYLCTRSFLPKENTALSSIFSCQNTKIIFSMLLFTNRYVRIIMCKRYTHDLFLHPFS